MPKAVNHPPTPAVESPTNPEIVSDDCEALKVKYGLNVATYSEHEEPKSRENNSHHILQDATVSDYIGKAEGLCVLLANAHSGTAHQITTNEQNGRRDNKRYNRGGTQPAKTLGQLKALSKKDLEKSFEQMGIPEPDRQALADCLVAEAEKKVKKAAKRDNDEDLDDSSQVAQTGGCFPAETMIWLDEHDHRRVLDIELDEAIQGRAARRPVARLDWCVSDLVRLRIGSDVVSLAPFHRVLTSYGGYRRADQLRPGTSVQTHAGHARLDGVARTPRPRRIHSIGVAAPFQCRIGRVGLWVELPNTGVKVTQSVRLTRFRPEPRRGGRHGVTLGAEAST